MSRESKSGATADPGGVTIPFGHKFTESEKFSVVFEEGMALVEATAAYLDGEGRAQSRQLPPAASLAYATVSMRLTTRLMQLASWLLIRRAVNEGEMTPEQAFEEQNKVKFQPVSNAVDEDAYAALPERLKEFNEASLSLHRRVMALDSLLKAELAAPPKAGGTHGVGEHLSRLAEAFGPIAEDVPGQDRQAADAGKPSGGPKPDKSA